MMVYLFYGVLVWFLLFGAFIIGLKVYPKLQKTEEDRKIAERDIRDVIRELQRDIKPANVFQFGGVSLFLILLWPLIGFVLAVLC